MSNFSSANRQVVREEERHCDDHGSYLSRNYFLKVWSQCPACATIRDENERLATELRESARRHDETNRRLHSSGIPTRFLSASLDNFVCLNEGQARVRSWALRYLQEFDDIRGNGRCFLLIGETGTGKTHIASAIGVGLIKAQQRSARLTTMAEMLSGVKATWQTNSVGPSERNVMAGFCAPDLLILDEVGVQFGTETERMITFSIINARYEALKPTLFLSNEPPADVKNLLGERVFDRIRDRGGRLVRFDWQSQRN